MKREWKLFSLHTKAQVLTYPDISWIGPENKRFIFSQVAKNVKDKHEIKVTQRKRNNSLR